MTEILSNSLFFGVGISVGTYILGTIIKKKIDFFLFNPLLLAITMTIATLLVTGIEYSEYNNGAKYLSYLLTPATVALAIPLYEQVTILKKNLSAILIPQRIILRQALFRYSDNQSRCHPRLRCVTLIRRDK